MTRPFKVLYKLGGLSVEIHLKLCEFICVLALLDYDKLVIMHEVGVDELTKT